MMRNALCLVAILIAACGEEKPVKVAEEPDRSVEARAEARKAQQAWEARGIKDPFAGSGFSFDDFRPRSSNQFVIHEVNRSKVGKNFLLVVSAKPRYRAK